MRTELDPKVYTDTYNLMCVYVLYLDKVYSLAWSKALAVQKRKLHRPSGRGATPANKTLSPATHADGLLHLRPPQPLQPTRRLLRPLPLTSHLQQAPPPAEGASDQPCVPNHDPPGPGGCRGHRQTGAPVPGLKQSDFTRSAGRQAATSPSIRAAHRNAPQRAQGPAAAANTPKLPPNTYSNHPAAATADSWTIVLFDLLNTPTADQEYARKQLIEMLRAAPKGQPIALYLLTSRLTMVQGFTDEPDKLLQAAESLRPNRFACADDRSGTPACGRPDRIRQRRIDGERSCRFSVDKPDHDADEPGQAATAS